MKVTGFSFIRNGIKYDYPIVEAIRSILPVCDEFVVAVGKSEDQTLELIHSIDPKIRIIETVWDDSLREGGAVLAKETDKALRQISTDSDWAFYIQGDEVVHEKYLDVIRNGMFQWKDNKQVEGLLFKYKHFYGSYDYIGSSPRWYRNEVRIVRPHEQLFSYRDAQGFRLLENNTLRKLRVVPLEAYVYHYGWVKDPRAMQRKQQDFNKLWHDDDWIENHVAKAEQFDYSKVDALEKFDETHPKVMLDRIERVNWKFDYDLSFNKMRPKDKFKLWTEKVFGFRVGEYKNYELVKK